MVGARNEEEDGWVTVSSHYLSYRLTGLQSPGTLSHSPLTHPLRRSASVAVAKKFRPMVSPEVN